MTPNPTSTMLMLFLEISTFILIMLLPAFLELKQPKDAGPRRIYDFEITPYPLTKMNLPLVDIDEEQVVLDQKILSILIELIL
ncbi:MAG: hypothetical protein QW468_02140 [Candidatus Bathyarchaeia archaeon]